MGRTSPGRTILIKYNRKLLFNLRHLVSSRLLRLHKTAGSKIDRFCSAHSHHCFRRLKALPRGNLFLPVSKLPVCKSAAYCKILILPEKFHLPGSPGIQLRSPEHMTFRIFHEQPGKIIINRKRTCLPKPFTLYRIHIPAGIQLESFQR